MEAATNTAGGPPSGEEKRGQVGALARLARGELGSLRVLVTIAVI